MTSPSLLRRHCSIALVAVFMLVGCSNALPTTPGDQSGVDPMALDDNPESLPDLMQPRIVVGEMTQGVWIPGGRRVAALIRTAGLTCSLDVIDADTRSTTEVLQGVLCNTEFRWLAVAPDGAALYYLVANDTAAGNESTTMRRVNLANRGIVDILTIPRASSGLWSFALSPDGQRLAYGVEQLQPPYGGSGINVHDLTTGSDTLVVAYGLRVRGWDVRFSPDGTELLFADSSGFRLRRFTIATGASQFVPEKLAGTEFEWTPTGVQFVAATTCMGTCQALTNLTTGQRLGLHGDESALGWSADGLHVAGVTSWCTGPGFSCIGRRPEIAVADWPTHKATVIARENCSEYPVPRPVVSPDGSTVIYGTCSGTYIWTRP